MILSASRTGFPSAFRIDAERLLRYGPDGDCLFQIDPCLLNSDLTLDRFTQTVSSVSRGVDDCSRRPKASKDRWTSEMSGRRGQLAVNRTTIVLNEKAFFVLLVPVLGLGSAGAPDGCGADDGDGVGGLGEAACQFGGIVGGQGEAEEEQAQGGSYDALQLRRWMSCELSSCSVQTAITRNGCGTRSLSNDSSRLV